MKTISIVARADNGRALDLFTRGPKLARRRAERQEERTRDERN